MTGQRHEPENQLEASDIEIGAVEIKDGTTDTRAIVNAANTARSTATNVLCVQPVDAEGHVADFSDLDDARIALQVIDDWDESDRAKVNPISGQAGIAGNTGTVSATTTRVTVATDDPQLGAVGAAADADGVLHGQLYYIANAIDALGSSGQALAYARIDIDLTGGSYGTLVAASVSNKIYIVEMTLTVSAQCELEFVEDPAGTPSILTTAPPLYFAQRGGIHLGRDPGYRFCTVTANKALGIDEVANGTVNIRGDLWYYYAA